MHPDRGILHTDRWSDGLSARPDVPNTLTLQSVGMNNAPRNPILHPVTHNPSQTQPGSTLCIRPRLSSCHLHQRHNCREHFASESRARPFPCELFDVGDVIGIISFFLVAISDLVWITVFWPDSTYYKCSNTDVGSTEQEIMKKIEHKVYTFYINL